VTRQKKTARARAVFNLNTSCKNAVGLVLSIASKQIPATLTNQPQLYLKRINSCKSIGNPYALVSPKHCELNADLSLTFKKADQSCCTNRVTPRTTRQSNWNHVDRAPLVRHTVNTKMERAVAMTKINKQVRI